MSARNSLIVCIVLAVFAARPVQAASFMGGFKGGFNETTMTGFTEDVGWRNTFVLGAVGAWEVRPWFIVLAEPSFVGQGCDLDSIPNSGLQLT